MPMNHRVKISGPGIIYTSSADVVSSEEGQRQIEYLRVHKKLIMGEGKVNATEKMNETAYISVTQLARRFGVDRSTIWRWVQRGTLAQPIRFSDQCTRWRIEDVEIFEREREQVKETLSTKRSILANAALSEKRAKNISAST